MWQDIEQAMEDLQKTLSNYKEYQKIMLKKNTIIGLHYQKN